MTLVELQEYLKKYVVMPSGRVNRYASDRKWWERNNLLHILDEMNDKFSYYKFTDNYVQWIYNIINDISEVPLCEVCKENPKLFTTFLKGYKTCCSNKCAKNHPDFNEKRRKTCLEKYGVEHPTKLPEEQEKRRQTNLEKYGVLCSV